MSSLVDYIEDVEWSAAIERLSEARGSRLSESEVVAESVSYAYRSSVVEVTAKDHSDPRPDDEDDYVSVIDLYDRLDAMLPRDNDDRESPEWKVLNEDTLALKALGVTTFSYKGAAVTRFGRVWTFIVPNGDAVVAKCIGTRGDGCQYRTTFGEFVAKNLDGTYWVPTQAQLHALQYAWIDGLTNHGLNCPGRKTRYNR